MTALYTSEPSDEDAQAFCEPVHVDTGFVYEHRLLFTEWLTSTTFKSVVPRKTFEVRSEVLCALAGGQSPRQIAEKGMASMTFVQKNAPKLLARPTWRAVLPCTKRKRGLTGHP